MSPILVRPVREQLEHDRVIRLLQVRLKRKGDVVANIGESQTVPVRIGQVQIFPDLVLTTADRGHKLIGTVEVETAESVNHLEAMAQWAHLGRARAPFHLTCRQGRSRSRVGSPPRTRSTSPRCGASTRSAIRPASRWFTAARLRSSAPAASHAAPRRRRPTRPAAELPAVASKRPAAAARKAAPAPRRKAAPPGLASRRPRRRQACAGAEEEVVLPYLRFSRDKRGYENTFVVHSDRRRGRVANPHSSTGSAPRRASRSDDPRSTRCAIRSIEQHNPDVEFDWTQDPEGAGRPRDAAPQGTAAVPTSERRPRPADRPSRAAHRQRRRQPPSADARRVPPSPDAAIARLRRPSVPDSASRAAPIAVVDVPRSRDGGSACHRKMTPDAGAGAARRRGVLAAAGSARGDPRADFRASDRPSSAGRAESAGRTSKPRHLGHRRRRCGAASRIRVGARVAASGRRAGPPAPPTRWRRSATARRRVRGLTVATASGHSSQATRRPPATTPDDDAEPDEEPV